MNYVNMIERLEDGLTIIEDVAGDLDVMAHAYMVAVPNCTRASFKANGKEDALVNLGWSWSKDFGWVFPVIG
jgi:hypothetical protein